MRTKGRGRKILDMSINRCVFQNGVEKSGRIFDWSRKSSRKKVVKSSVATRHKKGHNFQCASPNPTNLDSLESLQQILHYEIGAHSRCLTSGAISADWALKFVLNKRWIRAANNADWALKLALNQRRDQCWSEQWDTRFNASDAITFHCNLQCNNMQ